MFFDRYKELCQSHGSSPSAVAIKLGINKGTVSQWKNKGYAPRQDILIKIADFFNVSVDYLLGKTDTKEKTHSDESESGRDFIVVHRNGKTQKYHMTAEQIKALEPLLKQLRDEEGPDF